MSVKTFRLLLGNCLLSAGLIPAGLAGRQAQAGPLLQAVTDHTRPAITFLSWDTEGGGRIKTNLLRAGSAAELRVQKGGQWLKCDTFAAPPATQPAGTRYQIAVPDQKLTWAIDTADGGLSMAIAVSGPAVAGVELTLPFDPRVTATTLLSSSWTEEGVCGLPAAINAPDFGPMLVTQSGGQPARLRLEGSRAEKWVNVTLTLPKVDEGGKVTLTLSPLLLPPPSPGCEPELWTAARRGWLNALQACSRWGDQTKAFSAPAGVLGNNVISDPASSSLWFYADQAFWIPEIAPGLSVAQMVRRTIDWWLDHRTRPGGEVICYWDYGGFLDANAGPIIAAWDYVESTGDNNWLRKRIERIEFIADFLARRDLDNDGLIEAVQSGNLGTLVQPNRSCCWWDALNCGHKDGYSNAVIYRAWRCLADLESKLGREAQHERYTSLADRLKAAYADTLMNPRTGWLAWWKSRDGELHDYASPTLNGLAIEYGLVEPEPGRRILDRLWAKIESTGFKRFDLGVPPMLVPVRRGDYLLPEAIGLPKLEDGTDTFGQYMNGGITAGHVLHFLAAHYVLGDNARADKVLRAMLERQQRGEFQNGVTDAAMQGIDWTTWDGKPSGYEGYLADSFRFLQAVLLRDPSLREKLYRPLHSR